jgi:hypothetical protein
MFGFFAVKRLTMKRRVPLEDEEQAAVVRELNERATPGVVWLAIPNGDLRHPLVAKRLKATGTAPGAPDLVLIHRCTCYCLELKRERGGRVSDAQHGFHIRLKAAGAVVAVARGRTEAIRQLEFWGLLQPRPHGQKAQAA